MKQIKLTVPDNWADITVRQYQEFMKILDSNKRERTKTMETVSLFCGVDKKILKSMSYADLKKIANILLQMTSEDPSEIKIKRHIQFKNKTFSIIPNMSKMTTGEFVDLEAYCENTSENMHKIMAVLYREQTEKVDRFGRYKVEDYETNEEKKEQMKDLPMDCALGVLNFFFHLGEKLLVSSSNYLQKLNKEQKKEVTAE
jgi:hypothetical protein